MPGVRCGLSRERCAGDEPACGLAELRTIPAWSMAAGIAIIFFGLISYAKLAGHWNTDLPKQVYLQLVPAASEQQHPMPGAQ